MPHSNGPLAPPQEREVMPHYHAGWNMPGYLPEMEPPAFAIAEFAYAWLSECVTDWSESAVCDQPDAAGEPCEDCSPCRQAAELRHAAGTLSLCLDALTSRLALWV